MGMSEGTGKLADQHLTYLVGSVDFTEKEIGYLNSRIVVEEGEFEAYAHRESKFPVNFIEGVLPAINDKS